MILIAVFAVSDSPAIHSNSFHFCFAPQTYIEPVWLDECHDECTVLNDCRDWTSNTAVHLPLVCFCFFFKN